LRLGHRKNTWLDLYAQTVEKKGKVNPENMEKNCGTFQAKNRDKTKLESQRVSAFN
jgi:hypothetical protein